MVKRIALLTGCTGTFGEELIRAAGEGYQLVGVARRPPPTPGAGACDFIQGDVCADAERIVETALERWGRIDLLINNAVLSRWGSLTDDPCDSFLRELETNVVAPLSLANAALQRYWRRRPADENVEERRHVLNVSSTAALRVYPLGQGTYAATKAALNTLTLHMASEYRRFGVRVNALAPTSFPGILSTRSVVEAALELDAASFSGCIRVMDGPDHQYWL